jgi:GNAT superfamily N-acetyltransferase
MQQHVTRDTADVAVGILERTETSAEALYSLFQELRPGLGRAAFAGFLSECDRLNNQVMVAWGADRRAIGVATARATVTSRGRILFVDDLVTTRSVRGCGVGAVLLTALHEHAHRMQCESVELDTGVTNTHAQRFYLGAGFSIGAFHLNKPVGG